MEPTNGQNKEKGSEEGDNVMVNNDCCECKEGCKFVENVYCSIDGCFHPLRDKCPCKSFISIKAKRGKV